ncbi:MAG: paraquat-inducible protein A [Gammaproteobacteria bacterium]|nr:paraquat-inducible protein A [Gammaproteobacteria bacterium]
MKAKNKKRLISTLLVTAFILFVVACFSPLFTLSKFFIFNNTVSLFSALAELWNEHYYTLFMVLFLFSVFFPLVKVVLMFYLQLSTRVSQQRHKKLIVFLELVGKWSMLDVFVVAILLVTIKLGPMANVEVHYGLYVFLVSILMMMFTSGLMRWKG